MKRFRGLFAIVLTALLSMVSNAQERTVLQPVLRSSHDLSRWSLDGSGSWRIAGGKLILWKAGTPSGPIRRPAALAILRSPSFRAVTLEADLRSTAPLEVVRRDLDIVVGYESPSRFYYVHLAAVTDDVHNGIFLVDGADRRRIDSGKGLPKLIDTSWHHVRVERDGRSGRIEVFFDRSKEPMLTATDKTIRTGRVGVGSFDDTGEFRKIVVSAAQH